LNGLIERFSHKLACLRREEAAVYLGVILFLKRMTDGF